MVAYVRRLQSNQLRQIHLINASMCAVVLFAWLNAYQFCAHFVQWSVDLRESRKERRKKKLSDTDMTSVILCCLTEAWALFLYLFVILRTRISSTTRLKVFFFSLTFRSAHQLFILFFRNSSGFLVFRRWNFLFYSFFALPIILSFFYMLLLLYAFSEEFFMNVRHKLYLNGVLFFFILVCDIRFHSKDPKVLNLLYIERKKFLK